MKSAIQQAMDHFGGSATALAKAIGGDVKRQNVEHWLKSGRVPVTYAPSVERLVGIACEVQHPDSTWMRIADPGWPWHPAGRPLLDLTRATTTQPQPAAQPVAANA